MSDQDKKPGRIIVPGRKKLILPQTNIRLLDPTAQLPFAGSTHAIARSAIINPPPGPGRDRTAPDKDRFRDRMRGKIKDKLGDIIKDNAVFGDKGKIRIPVDGGKEPRWRPGRDGQGGGKGRKGGKDKGDLVYVDVTYEEFIQMLFDDLELPFMLKKDKSSTLIKTHKLRGMQPNGPDARIDWEETEVARIERAIAMLNANPQDFPGLDPDKDIPGHDLVPIEEIDKRYKRIEERYDPDSKAVAFLLLDRSGSMGGDPLAIAKFYFLLNVLFLRTKYKDVAVVMIAHDAAAYRITNEMEFYQIEVAGGTMFVPAYEMTLDIANQEFPSSVWNRYMFHATDGYMFDGEDEVTQWWDRLIRTAEGGGSFNFAGYLEIDPWGGRGSTSWAPGGQALLNLPADIKAHVGMARVSHIDEVIEAFKAILTKDKV